MSVTGPLRVATLVAAGFAGGTIGTAGAITSLVSYPALLAVGVPPLVANVTNLVAAVCLWPASALASRRELEGQRRRLVPWLILSCLGAAAGSVLLLATSQHAFTIVVPFLVLASAAALVAQPRFGRRSSHSTGRVNAGARIGGLSVIGVYNGYFGAGSGIMTLALLLFTTRLTLPVANANKNMLVGVAAVVSAVVFIVAAKVDWAAAVPLGAGMFLGGLLGPRLTRSIRTDVVRWVIAGLAVVLAVALWINPTL